MRRGEERPGDCARDAGLLAEPDRHALALAPRRPVGGVAAPPRGTATGSERVAKPVSLVITWPPNPARVWRKRENRLVPRSLSAAPKC